jgi:hypothetical protein
MSRILNRPMFRRGGKVNSKGVGITSGLDESRQEYQVGSDMYGVQQSPDYGLNDYYENLYTPQVRRPITQRERLEQIKNERAAKGGDFFTSLFAPTESQLARRMTEKERIQRDIENRPLYESYQAQAEQEEKGRLEALNRLKTEEEKVKDLVDKNIPAEKSLYEITKQDLEKETELYSKLLGGEEAKSQAIYNALLAASPAFFKGKNLREALPEVLSSVEKSRALDKPMDVRQVAAQLALQRRITLDKAAAEERTRLALLAAKETGKTPEELYTEFKKVDPTEAINLAGYSTYKDKFAGPAPLIKSGKQQQFDSSKIDFNKIYSYGSSFITFKEQTNPDTGLREIVPVTIKSYK